MQLLPNHVQSHKELRVVGAVDAVDAVAAHRAALHFAHATARVDGEHTDLIDGTFGDGDHAIPRGARFGAEVELVQGNWGQLPAGAAKMLVEEGSHVRHVVAFATHDRATRLL